MRNLHNDPLPIGLFIPFARAYDAVKEFIETNGALPKCIEWVENNTLPPNTFPVPHDPIVKANLWKGPRPLGY